jgi:hypothetical protein
MDTKALRYALARKVYKTEAIVAACESAGIDYAYVNLNGAPIDVWFDALHRASLMSASDRERAISVLSALVADEAHPRCPHCGGVL